MCARRSTSSTSAAATCTRRSKPCAPPTSTSEADSDGRSFARQATAYRAPLRRARAGEQADDRAGGAQAGRLPRPAGQVAGHPRRLETAGARTFRSGPLFREKAFSWLRILCCELLAAGGDVLERVVGEARVRLGNRDFRL